MPFPIPAPGLPLALLLAAASPQPALRACPVTTSAATEVMAPDCAMKHCAAPAPDVSVCRCVVQPARPGQDWTATYRVTRLGAAREWVETLTDKVPDQMGPMDVVIGDVSGGGGQEIVIAEQTAVSNGIAIRSWTLTILQAQPPFRPVATVDIPEYGPGTLARRLDGGRGCDVLVTDLGDRCRTTEADGMIVGGHWMRLHPDGLKPLPARPALPRRHVGEEAFAEDRGNPAAWFADGSGGDQSCPSGTL